MESRASSQPVTDDRRNSWLRASDSQLLSECREEHRRASGPGGQRRNKVETAIRLQHLPSGLSAQASESRSLAENRRRALRRLRERIAFDLRSPMGDLPLEFDAQRQAAGRIAINPHNPAFPLVAATALDALAQHGGYAPAAAALGVTTSQLQRLLRSAPELWRAASAVQKVHQENTRGPSSKAVSDG